MTEPSQPGNEAQEGSPRSITERILQLVTLAAGVVALPVAILQGRPASAVAALVVVVAGLGLLIAHVWQSRLPSGQYRYSWWRWFTVATTVVIIAVLAGVNLNAKSRSVFIYGVMGFHKQAEADELVIAESSKYYRIQLPVSNHQGQDDQLDAVTLTLQWNSNTGIGCLATPVSYQLADHIVLAKNGNIATAPVKASSGGFAGFDLPTTGSLHEYCMSGALTFTFYPGLIIEADSTTLMYVNVPKHINATYEQIGAPYNSTKRGHIVADATGIPDPVNGGTGNGEEYSFVIIQANVKFISGETYSSCRMIRGIYVSRQISDGGCS
jgi:hypothetical protein